MIVNAKLGACTVPARVAPSPGRKRSGWPNDRVELPQLYSDALLIAVLSPARRKHECAELLLTLTRHKAGRIAPGVKQKAGQSSGRLAGFVRAT